MSPCENKYSNTTKLAQVSHLFTQFHAPYKWCSSPIVIL